MKKLMLLVLCPLLAQAAPTEHRIDRLPDRHITITAVEFTTTPVYDCEVFYWHPDDADQNGDIDSCRNIEYNPCDALDAQLVLVRYVMGGGSCDPLPPPLECDFSPLPPGCP